MSDQVTRHSVLKGCGGCSKLVLHLQVADYAASGFKSYTDVPVEHRRSDGSICTFRADLRKGAWVEARDNRRRL